jgi:hypothetical protein
MSRSCTTRLMVNVESTAQSTYCVLRRKRTSLACVDNVRGWNGRIEPVFNNSTWSGRAEIMELLAKQGAEE